MSSNVNDSALQTIARVTRTLRRELHRDVTLKDLGLTSSIGLSTLHGALQRQLGLEVSELHWDMSIGQLLDQLQGAGASPASAPVALAVESPPIFPIPVGLGVDLEEVASLPEGPDEEGFYSSHFTEAELQAAVSHPQKRAHLCGLWCAKEALRKCGPELLALRFLDIEVRSDPAGRPSIQVLRADIAQEYQFLVSISHTSNYATATVMSYAKVRTTGG